MAKQVIYRRGTTAEHANFVGANGEITVDTVKHVVIVHDGATPGGFPVATASTVTASINTLTSNAAAQAGAITVLQANAATQANAIAALQSNAATQQTSINDFILASNATVIFANIAGVRANVEAANVQIGLLYGNATVQSEAIVLANANITALQSGLTAANSAIASFVTGSGFANVGQLTANITAVNSAISTQGVTFATNVAVAALRANVTAANSAISSLQANIAAANVAINNIALSPSLIAEVTQSVTTANASMKSYVDAVTSANNGDLTITNQKIAGGGGEVSLILDPGANKLIIGPGTWDGGGYDGLSFIHYDDRSLVYSSGNNPGGSSRNLDIVGGVNLTLSTNWYVGSKIILDPAGDGIVEIRSSASITTGGLTFPDSTVQTTAYRLWSLSQTFANVSYGYLQSSGWANVSLSQTFQNFATTNSEMFIKIVPLVNGSPRVQSIVTLQIPTVAVGANEQFKMSDSSSYIKVPLLSQSLLAINTTGYGSQSSVNVYIYAR